jgi:hypothetical protein
VIPKLTPEVKEKISKILDNEPTREVSPDLPKSSRIDGHAVHLGQIEKVSPIYKSRSNIVHSVQMTKNQDFAAFAGAWKKLESLFMPLVLTFFNLSTPLEA